MAISVDDTTVVRTSTTIGSDTADVSTTFTPPNGSLILVALNSDGGTTPSFTASGGSLTWHAETIRPGTGGGFVQWFWAIVGTGASMTVTLTRNSGDSVLFSFKTYIVTGQHATTPVAQSTGGTASSDPSTLSLYTSSVNNSRAFYVCTDWNDTGTPTSTDTEDAFNIAGIDGLSAYKAADTATSGTAVTGQYDGGGALDLSWAALEIAPVPSDEPVLTSSTPSGGATGVSRTANVALTFDENVTAGSGSFEIWNTTRGVLFESIPVGDGRVSISTTTVTINPTGTFEYGADYALKAPAGIVVASDDSTPWVGITDFTTLSFRVTELTDAGTSGGLLVGSSAGFVGEGFVGSNEAAAGATLTAGAGTLTLSGTAAALRHAYVLVATPGALSLSGTAASLIRGPTLTATPGSLTLAGTAVALRHDSRIACTPGSLTLTGQDATLTYTQVIVATTGAPPLPLFQQLIPPFWPPANLTLATSRVARGIAADVATLTLTGVDVGLRKGWALVASPGALTATGTSTTLRWGRVVIAASGSLTLSGTAATLLLAHKVACSPGTLTLSGQDAGLSYSGAAKALAAAPGSLTLSGTAASLIRGRTITAGSGSLALTGTAAALTRGRTLPATPGALMLSGTPATLTVAHKLAVTPGALALTGVDATFQFSGGAPTLSAQPGSLTLAGTNATLSVAHKLAAQPGSLTATGTPTRLAAGRRLTVFPGGLTTTALPASITKASRLAAGSGSLAITGTTTALRRGVTLAAAAAALLLAGTNATFSRTYRLAATPGSLVLNGTSATLQFGTAHHRAPNARTVIFQDDDRIASFTSEGRVARF